MPRIYNKKRDSIPPDATYVGRPTKFGNMFSHKEGTLARYQVDTRAEAIEAYRVWLLGQPELVATVKAELKGKDLVCWCRPPKGFNGRLMCHAQILAGIANDIPPEEVE